MSWSQTSKVLDNITNQYTYAIACPSEVDVPRPSSSNATKEFWVAEDYNRSKTYTITTETRYMAVI